MIRNEADGGRIMRRTDKLQSRGRVQCPVWGRLRAIVVLFYKTKKYKI